MENQKKSEPIKIKLSTVVLLFIIFVLIVALGITYYLGFILNKNEYLDNSNEVSKNVSENAMENAISENEKAKNKVDSSSSQEIYKYVWESYPKDMKEKITEWLVGEKTNDILDNGQYKLMKNTLYSLYKKYPKFSNCPFKNIYDNILVIGDSAGIIKSSSNYLQYTYSWNDDLPLISKYSDIITYDASIIHENYINDDISDKENLKVQYNDLKKDYPNKEFYFEVPSMLIMNGNNISEKEYKNNARAKKIKVTINKDKEYTFDLKDTNAVQVFDIDYKQNNIEKPVNIEVEVLDKYSGEKTQDVYISDMQFSINSNIPQGR